MVTTDEGVLSGPTAVSGARRRVRAVAAGGLSPTQVEDAVLMTSELATNALAHGGGRFTLAADDDGERLRIEVHDDRPVLPVILPVQMADEHGRGLVLVRALSSRFGWEQCPGGKTVWFELDHLAPV